MTDQAPHRREHEHGTALLVTMFILFLIAGIALMSIAHSGAEAAGSGRTRVAMRALQAADAGIQFAANRIAQNPPQLDAFDIVLPGNRRVQSRTRSDAGPLPIPQSGIAAPPEGMSILVGSGFMSEIYHVNVTAEGGDLGVAQIEAKIARLSTGSN